MSVTDQPFFIMGHPCFLNCILASLLALTSVSADPLSKSKDINFFRDVTSRHLQGAATRSDGQLMTGPTVSALEVNLGHELLWTLLSDGDDLLIGTGPTGRILSLNPKTKGLIEPKVELELPDNHIFAVARLPDGSLLAGTSPHGSLVVSKDGIVIAQARLPVGSVLDIHVTSSPNESETFALVATGNPGRIYRVDLRQLIHAGVAADTLTTEEELASHGIVRWGSIRDDNIRRIVQLSDGSIIAGSAPKGNVYAFSAQGGAPTVLAEHKNAEVSDILPWEGGFFAAVTFTNASREARMKQTPPPSASPVQNGDKHKPDAAPSIIPPPTPEPRFRGRSHLLWLPDDGYPEVVATRSHSAFYQLARHKNFVVITGGERGELFGYDPANRRSLTFPGGTAAQLNSIVPSSNIPGAFYAIGNNPSSLELIRFSDVPNHSVETKRIDLGVPAEIGALHFDRPLTFPTDNLTVEMRASVSSDELEGWGGWQRAHSLDGAWRVSNLRGRYVQIRLQKTTAPFELSAARLYFLPKNHRPQLQNFHVLSPNYALIPAASRPERQSTTLGQIIKANGNGEGKPRDTFMNSEVVPQPGTQLVLWNAIDLDGDNLVSTFSIKADGQSEWSDIVIESRERFAQFEITHLPEGLYHSRLVISESDQRPLGQRLSTTVDTDDFIVDRTAPEILEATITNTSARITVTVRAKDERSLLRGLEINFNNGASFEVEQPLDGILDGREETFVMTISGQQISGSTSLEVVILDQSDNSSARRLKLPLK